MKEIEKLKPFTKFLMTIGQLPSSYLISMTYEEQLLWFCNYLQNTVIPTVNNNAEAVIELQNYVSSYFDNLDVQEEINNKLDEMAESGELTLLIKNYVDPIMQEYQETINQEISEQNAMIIEQNNAIDAQDTAISSISSQVLSIASGSPAGTYSTVSDLTTDDPDHTKIYLVLADGKWYYYDESNSEWTAGGVYQATNIGDASVNRNNLNIPLIGNIVGNGNLSIDYNSSTGNITFTYTNLYITHANGYVSVTGDTKTITKPSGVSYICVDKNQSNNYEIFLYTNTNLGNITKNNCYILGYIYSNTIFMYQNDSHINITGLKNYFDGNYSYNLTMRTNKINLDTINKQIIIPSGSYIVISEMKPFLPNADMVADLTQANYSNFLILFDFINNSLIVENANNNQTRNKNYIPLCIVNNTRTKIFPIIDVSNFSIDNVNLIDTLIDYSQIDNYITINSQLSDITNPNTNTKIVLVGDSITAGVGGTNYAESGDQILDNGTRVWYRNDNGYCWANLFKAYIEDKYNATVLNNGCEGIHLNTLVTYWSQLVPNDTDILIVSLGTNNRAENYSSGYSSIVNNLKTIVERCIANNIKLIVNSPIPSSATDEARFGNENEGLHLYDVNNIIADVMSSYNREYNNMYNSIYYYCFDTNTNWENCLSGSSKIHPNDTGYRIMFYMMLKGLNLAPKYTNVD